MKTSCAYNVTRYSTSMGAHPHLYKYLNLIERNDTCSHCPIAHSVLITMTTIVNDHQLSMAEDYYNKKNFCQNNEMARPPIAIG